MGIGDAQDFEHALDRAVFAAAAVQRVEGDVGLEAGERGGDVAVDVDPADAIAARFQRVGAAAAGIERNRPLGRPTAHQHRYVLHRPSEAGRSAG